MMSRSRRMRGVGSPVLETLRHYWSTAVLLVATGMLVLATVLPVTSLAGPGTTSGTRLAVSPAGASDLGLHWSSNATSPATTRQQAVGFLFQLLLVAGVAALIIAALSILSLSAARASARAPEVSVRRAVGASKRTLLAASLLEGGLVAAAVLALGCALGVIEARIAAAAWPGTVAPWRLA